MGLCDLKRIPDTLLRAAPSFGARGPRGVGDEPAGELFAGEERLRAKRPSYREHAPTCVSAATRESRRSRWGQSMGGKFDGWGKKGRDERKKDGHIMGKNEAGRKERDTISPNGETYSKGVVGGNLNKITSPYN